MGGRFGSKTICKDRNKAKLKKLRGGVEISQGALKTGYGRGELSARHEGREGYWCIRDKNDSVGAYPRKGIRGKKGGGRVLNSNLKLVTFKVNC